MYILGDLNCNLLQEKALFNAPTSKLNSIYELYQLSQLINEPTRVTLTTSSLIDHVVTNTPEKISHSGVVHTGISDRSLIYAIRKIKAGLKSHLRMCEFFVYVSLTEAEVKIAQLQIIIFSSGLESVCQQSVINANRVTKWTACVWEAFYYYLT